MKIRTGFMTLAIALVTCAGWAADSPAIDLPIYPGGESTMEINLGNADILPTLNAMLPLMSGKFGAIMAGVSPDDLAAILKNVSRVEMVQVEVAKSGVSEADVATFYSKKLPTGKWSRVFWQSQPKGGIMAVFVQDGMEAIYGFKIETITSDGKPIKRAQVAEIIGKIDFAKIISIASKIAVEQHSTPTVSPGADLGASPQTP